MVFKSSRKKLIAAGCSFTEHYLSSNQSPNADLDFPRWPEHLSNMLDMECVNVGQRGAGNDQILARTLDATLKEKDIGLVVIMWSEWRRMGFQSFPDPHQWVQITPHDMQDWKSFYLEKQNPFHATRNALRTFIYAERLLGDTPYMFLQGTGTIWWNESSFGTNKNRRRIAANEILASPYFDYIENKISNKFIGWPLMNEIGGYNIEDILDKEDPTRFKYRISKGDTHPNDAGHKVIAEFLYEQYKEIYNEN
jgi:hypothetical protein